MQALGDYTNLKHSPIQGLRDVALGSVHNCERFQRIHRALSIQHMEKEKSVVMCFLIQNGMLLCRSARGNGAQRKCHLGSSWKLHFPDTN